MQNNNQGNQNAPDQAVPNPNVKPKFSCRVCSFTCNSLQNFRIHLQNFKSHYQSALPKANETSQSPTTNAQSPAPQTSAEKTQSPTTNAQSPAPQTSAEKTQSPTTNAQSPAPQTSAEKTQSPTTNAQSPAPQTSAEKTQNPTTNAQSPAPQTTAEKTQDNNKGNQNASTQAVPNVKAKFSCKDCSYTCNSVLNYRIHLKTVHGKVDEDIQNTSTLKKAEQKKEIPAVNIQTEKKKEKPAVNIQIEKKKAKPALSFQIGKRKAVNIHAEKRGKAAKNIQPGSMTGNSGRNIEKLIDYISRADREPLIGLEYVLEYCFLTESSQIETKYFCELCECDTDVDPMVEHLAGFAHRKLYLAKEYPYVLKAQSTSKEDQSQFIRRMALEIEREEGTKMYMIDESMWMETMMTLRAAEKKMKKKTRWDDDKNDKTRMKKALKFLESFEIDNEIEATTVTRLCEKLTDNLKFYNKKTKEDALFPSRVARAQDVAVSLMKNAERQRTHLQTPTQKSYPKIPPQFMKGPPTFPENVNLMHKVGMRSGFPGTNFQNMDAKHDMSKAPPYQQAQQYQFAPSNEKPTMQGPSMSRMKENPQKAENTQSDDSFLKNLSQEDTQFFKKLKALLEVLPQNASLSDNSQMNSKLLMLKSLLVNKNRAEPEQANQKLMMHVASMVQDTVSAQNSSLNQQLTMLMTSQNSTAMVMQTSSLRNNPMQQNENSVMSRAGLGPGIQSSGNKPTNMNSLLPFNQNFGSQVHGQMGEKELRPMNQNTYENYPSTSQNYDNFGYGNSVEGKYLSQGDPYIRKHDGTVNSLTAKQNERMRNPNTDMSYEPGVYDKKWDNSYYGDTSAQVPESRYVDHSKEQAPYTRVCLSPSSPHNQYDDYNNDNIRGEVGRQDTRHQHGLRSYTSSDWDDQESDMRYMKRAKLDMANRSDRSESYHNRSLESHGINTAGMPEELKKRIEGKDLFTVSAIISDYSERRSGK